MCTHRQTNALQCPRMLISSHARHNACSRPSTQISASNSSLGWTSCQTVGRRKQAVSVCRQGRPSPKPNTHAANQTLVAMVSVQKKLLLEERIIYLGSLTVDSLSSLTAIVKPGCHPAGLTIRSGETSCRIVQGSAKRRGLGCV